MHFLTLTLPIVLSLLTTPVRSVLLSYDKAYDVANASLATVACSDGSHGLLTRGFTTFGSLPKFPYIGGSAFIEGWNSAKCGTCYQLTHANITSGAKKSVNVLAIDLTKEGFNIALKAMEELVGVHAAEIGTVDVEAKLVDAAVCGLR